SRVEEGAAAQVDLMRLETERDRARVDLVMARIDVDRATAELATFTGAPVRAAVDDMPIDIRSLPPLERLITLARARRPGLRAAHGRIAAAEAERRWQRSAVLRDVSGMAGVMSMGGVRSFM